MDTHEPDSSMSYKSSQTFTVNLLQIQPAALHRNCDISASGVQWMCPRNCDDETLLLDLVLALDDSPNILCDHERCCMTCFGPSWDFVSCQALSLYRGTAHPPLGRSQPDEDITTLAQTTLPHHRVQLSRQLGQRVQFRFSWQPCTKSAISPTSGIQMRHSLMHCKVDDDMLLLDLVIVPNDSWIVLCDHKRCCVTCFGPTRAMYHVGP